MWRAHGADHRDRIRHLPTGVEQQHEQLPTSIIKPDLKNPSQEPVAVGGFNRDLFANVRNPPRGTAIVDVRCHCCHVSVERTRDFVDSGNLDHSTCSRRVSRPAIR